jgi:hyperosmotically inducible protein
MAMSVLITNRGGLTTYMSLVTRTFAIVPALLLCMSWAEPAPAQNTDATQPDNTKTNKRDRSPGAVTADQQKMNSADRELSKKIRQAVVADKSLSIYAHNVKIISRDGVVTLKGPVHSDAEKSTIEVKAAEIAGGADKVKSEIAVKQ